MLQLNFTPFPELETERLLLRRMVLADAKELLFLRSDKAVLEFLGKEPAKTIEEVESFINMINNNIDTDEAIQWAITFKENPAKLIGTICYWNIRKEHYRAETGYTLHPDHWNKGIMKEALKKVINYGFSVMKLHSIDANINPGNKASEALLVSTGFVKEAHFKEDFFFRGKFSDTVIYSLLNLTSNLSPNDRGLRASNQ